MQIVDKSLSASDIMDQKPDKALPSIEVFQIFKGNRRVEIWSPQFDLIKSKKLDRHFVAEIDDNGYAILRFGDGVNGASPEQGSDFYARYRMGNGISGNVGAGSIAHILSDNPAIVAVCNPLPASGGREPESMEEVRVKAPMSFKTQERAVTSEDYVKIAESLPGVQKAAATFHWTGSWYTISLTIDRKGGKPVNEMFKKSLLQHLEKYRMTGHDLAVEGPAFVPLDLDLTVCVKPEYYWSHIRSLLLQVLGCRQLADGRLGIFHPDNLTFGQKIYLSSIYEAVLRVEGVESVEVTRFERRNSPGPEALNQGYLAMKRLEIARLNNDPNFPENGMIELNPKGGR
jgi:predicted phage baseplate assembly protein